jgi:hypothetical protein
MEDLAGRDQASRYSFSDEQGFNTVNFSSAEDQRLETRLPMQESPLQVLEMQHENEQRVQQEFYQLETDIPTFSNPLMSQLSAMFQTLNNKFYYCGFVYRLNNDGFWKYWMEQWGGVLHLWRVPEELASFAYTAKLPIEQFLKNELDPPSELMAAIKGIQEPEFINVLDGTVEGAAKDFNYYSEYPSPPIPYSNYFCFARNNSVVLFCAASMIQMNYWVNSIRLAIFEVLRLHLTFTNRWLRSPSYIQVWNQLGVEPFSSATFRGEVRFEGPLQVRIPWSTTWRQYHVVVTSKHGPAAYKPAGNLSQKIFNRTKNVPTDPSRRGTILVFNNQRSFQKGKPPLFWIQDVQWVNIIWPTDADEQKLKHISLAKLYGDIKLSDEFVSNQSTVESAERSLMNCVRGMKQIQNLQDLAAVYDGTDLRPLPHDVLFLAPSPADLAKWIAGILASFGIDPGLDACEEEIKEMTKLPEIENIDVRTGLVPVKWPTQLYLSLNEIGGITVLQTELPKTAFQYLHYLNQKMIFSQQDKLRKWCETAAKADWERSVCDRKEVEYKLLKLYDWLDLCSKLLQEHGIDTSRPHPQVLVSAMSSLVQWMAPVLNSLITLVKPPDTETVQPTESWAESKKIAATDKSDSPGGSSDGEGSISEEERSSEGSVSEEDPESPLPTVSKD